MRGGMAHKPMYSTQLAIPNGVSASSIHNAAAAYELTQQDLYATMRAASAAHAAAAAATSVDHMRAAAAAAAPTKRVARACTECRRVR